MDRKLALLFWDIDHSGASMRLLCRAGASKPQLYYVYGIDSDPEGGLKSVMVFRIFLL